MAINNFQIPRLLAGQKYPELSKTQMINSNKFSLSPRGKLRTPSHGTSRRGGGGGEAGDRIITNYTLHLRLHINRMCPHSDPRPASKLFPCTNEGTSKHRERCKDNFHGGNKHTATGCAAGRSHCHLPGRTFQAARPFAGSRHFSKNAFEPARTPAAWDAPILSGASGHRHLFSCDRKNFWH